MHIMLFPFTPFQFFFEPVMCKTFRRNAILKSFIQPQAADFHRKSNCSAGISPPSPFRCRNRYKYNLRRFNQILPTAITAPCLCIKTSPLPAYSFLPNYSAINGCTQYKMTGPCPEKLYILNFDIRETIKEAEREKWINREGKYIFSLIIFIQFQFQQEEGRRAELDMTASLWLPRGWCHHFEMTLKCGKGSFPISLYHTF